MIENFKIVKNPEELNGIKVYNNEREALRHILKGEEVARFEFGDSMMPILSSGQYCKLTPVKNTNEINVGDAVFCDLNGYLMTHMVLMKSNSSYGKPKFLISSSGLSVYGWTDKVYAIAKGIPFIEDSNEIKYAELVK